MDLKESSSTKLSSLTIFFPAYNEGENIQETIKQADTVAKAVADDYEILVINDGSKDNTAQKVKDAQSIFPKAKLINHPQNRGYGAALMTGFSNASKEWTFFSDADLQFDLKEISRLIAHTNEADVVIGYRIKRSDPPMRLLNAKSWNLLNRTLFGLKVRDIDCAFKLFKTKELQEVLPDMASEGAMISAELLIRLKRNGHEFTEVGVNHYPRTAGSPTGAKPSVIIRAFKELASVYRGDLGNEWVKKTITYMTIGVGNTLLDLLLYVFLSRSLGLLATRKTWAKGISYLISSMNSFLWNQSWTFKEKRHSVGVHLPFILVSFASLAINTGVMYVCYTAFMLSEFWSVMLATGITLLWNLLSSKFLYDQKV